MFRVAEITAFFSCFYQALRSQGQKARVWDPEQETKDSMRTGQTLLLPFLKKWMHKHTKTHLWNNTEDMKWRPRQDTCATAASIWSKMSCSASDSSLLYTRSAAAFFSASIKLPNFTAAVIELIHLQTLAAAAAARYAGVTFKKNIDSIVSPVVMCICLILLFMHT